MHFENKKDKMISRLRDKGISDEKVLDAIKKVPRHEFLPSAFHFQAYDEKALPIGHNQTISHPFTVAKMTEILEVKQGNKILEIGTGSGYQSAVLCELGAQVFTVEIVQELANRSKNLLNKLGYSVALRNGDGSIGWETYAPFNSIIVTAGAPVIPENLFNQLTIPGRLVIPVGSKDTQKLTLYQKNKDSETKREIEEFQFVPLKGLKGWKDQLKSK